MTRTQPSTAHAPAAKPAPACVSPQLLKPIGASVAVNAALATYPEDRAVVDSYQLSPSGQQYELELGSAAEGRAPGVAEDLISYLRDRKKRVALVPDLSAGGLSSATPIVGTSKVGGLAPPRQQASCWRQQQGCAASQAAAARLAAPAPCPAFPALPLRRSASPSHASVYGWVSVALCACAVPTHMGAGRAPVHKRGPHGGAHSLWLQ